MYWKWNLSNILTLYDKVYAIWCCGVVAILVDICIEHIQIITIKDKNEGKHRENWTKSWRINEPE